MRDNLNNFKQFGNSKTPIIVGFDPGLTIGLAILDLNGNLLFLDSFKEIARSEIITKIMKQGKAILIATDVEHPPKAVKKLASSLNAKIFFPKNDISVSYKNELVNDFLKNNHDFLDSSSFYDQAENNNSSDSKHRSVDAHERDSLSAAIIGYNNYKKKLDQLEKKFLKAKMNFDSNKEDIINDNYYEILNEAKSFLINDNPISESISKSFEVYGLSNNTKNNSSLNNTDNSTKDYKNNNNDHNIYNKNSNDSDSNNTNTNTNINNTNNSYSNNNHNNLNEIANGNKNDQNHSLLEELEKLEEKLNKLKNINRSQEKQIKNQDKIIENLKNKNNALSKELDQNNQKISLLEKELKESKLKESKAILRDKEVASKIKLLKTIQNKYKEEKKLRIALEEKLNKRLALDDFNELSMFTPIKIIKSFTKNGLNEANNIYKLKRDDLIYLSSSKGGGSQTAKYLVDLGIKAIITSKNNEIMPPQAEEIFEKNGIPMINEMDIDIKFFDDYAVADSKQLNKKIDTWKNNQKEKNNQKAQDDLLNVINEYRFERKREN